MIFVPKGDSVFQGCLLYQCLWKDKSGTKSSQCLSHKTCKLMRDPRRIVSHYCLKITQLVSIRDRIRTKAAKIIEMVSLIPCPRYQTQICSNTWDQPSSHLGSFVAGLAHMRHHSSMIGLLFCPLEPSPNLGLHSCGVSCLVSHGWSACLGTWPTSTVSGIPLPFSGPLWVSIMPGSVCLLPHCTWCSCHSCRNSR